MASTGLGLKTYICRRGLTSYRSSTMIVSCAEPSGEFEESS
jgi:DNA-directed RNA polymerase subunit N (RpoN/RPB10)